MIQKMKKGIKNVPIEKLLVFAGCLLVGFWYVYFYSVSTSPRYPDYFGHDSAQFQTLGMAWSKGYLPYGDLFDHKGPYIFSGESDRVSCWIYGNADHQYGFHSVFHISDW